jgi:CHAT domain-containing protein/Tfp pilus assembly protein PilF
MANLPPRKTRLRPSFSLKYLRFLPSFVFLLNLLAASVPGRVGLSVPYDDIPLLPGLGFNDKELAGGQAHTYKISVASANQYLRVVIEQRGINIVAALYNSQNKELLRVDNPSGAHGPIYVSTILQPPGDYRVEVRSTEKWAKSGRYKIAIEDLRDAKPPDTERVAADKNYVEGRQLYDRRNYTDALLKFQAANAYWLREGDRHWIALTEFCLGNTEVNNQVNTQDKLNTRVIAAEHFNKGLQVQIDERLDWRLRASLFNDRGANLGYFEDKEQEALESLNEAFKIYEKHQDRRGQASVFNNIGFLHLRAGRYRQASEILSKGLPLRRAENDRASEAILFNNIAGTLDQIGETRAALDGYQKALRIWEELNTQGLLTNPLERLPRGFNNVAIAHDKLGEWQLAFENYEKALSLYGTNRPVAAAYTLDSIGELYATLGDSRRAMEYYLRAKSLSEGKELRAEAIVLNHLGELYISQKDFAAALACYERVLIIRKDYPGQANAQTNIGFIYALQGKPQKALESYESALKLLKDGEDRRGEAFTLHKVGEARLLMHDSGKALEALNRALPIWRAITDKRGEVSTLYTIARVERDRGNLAEALELSKQAISIIESLRTKVTSQRLRSSFFASQQSHYDLQINIRMRLYGVDKSSEHLAAALEASEQSRARSLVDTLTEAGANLYQGVSDDLINQEREAQQKLNDKALRQTAVLSRVHSKAEADNIEKEVNQAIAEYDAIRDKIKKSSPAYAQLTNARSLRLSEIQQLLDDETLLLEYFLGEENSYLWLVSRSSITGFDSLPKRSEIEDEAKAYYEELTKLTSSLNDTRTRGGGRNERAASISIDPVALSRQLLDPVADKIGKKRLLIVGDGVLHYLPFGALPSPLPASGTPPRTAPSARTPYLIEEHEIVYLPAASVLSILRSETANRKPGSLSVAVIANPVFNADDERLRITKQAAPTVAPKQVSSNLKDSKRLRSGLELVPLPATELEAVAIKDAIGTRGRTKIAKDFDANRATVMKLQEEQYRIIHFATHGDLDTEHPELSAIVLSLFDSHGRDLKEDGFLRLHDIYNMKLPADMIVLSACKTGLGQMLKGEGLIGLTRGFMHAGSPRVVASLWRVEDLGTSELMKRFYQHLARENMAPPSALRQAQIEMLQSKRWNAPYFWAGFVLQGEWSAIR